MKRVNQRIIRFAAVFSSWQWKTGCEDRRACPGEAKTPLSRRNLPLPRKRFYGLKKSEKSRA
ncbi:MAG TPA: hypothetical protein IAA57_07270 [Candidatus Pullilachnospira intestinigallinarum]|nr:hypothetical protein [Candidatus Pullilachnospira intestinigallinarum]